MIEISIVITVYNEESSLTELYYHLEEVLNNIRLKHEIIWVNDGSSDNSANILDEFHKKDERNRVIHFKRNFGKSAALSAGFEAARGKYVITMDGDLQDDPEEIPAFIEKIRNYDVIVGWKRDRKDPFSRRFSSKIFNWLSRRLTGINIHDFNCGFKIFRQDVIKNIQIYGELHRYIPALANWKGYSVGEMIVKHHKRKYGKSKWGISRLLKGALDLLTVSFLTGYMTTPMHIFGISGGIMIVSGLTINIYLVYIKLLYNAVIGDRPLLILGVLLIIVGVQLLFYGLLAEIMINLSGRKEYIISRS